jgi:hypothetical protein
MPFLRFFTFGHGEVAEADPNDAVGGEFVTLRILAALIPLTQYACAVMVWAGSEVLRAVTDQVLGAVLRLAKGREKDSGLGPVLD